MIIRWALLIALSMNACDDGIRLRDDPAPCDQADARLQAVYVAVLAALVESERQISAGRLARDPAPIEVCGSSSSGLVFSDGETIAGVDALAGAWQTLSVPEFNRAQDLMNCGVSDASSDRLEIGAAVCHDFFRFECYSGPLLEGGGLRLDHVMSLTIGPAAGAYEGRYFHRSTGMATANSRFPLTAQQYDQFAACVSGEIAAAADRISRTTLR